jgi:hypothetical protein
LSGLFYKYRELDSNNYSLDILLKKELWLAEPASLNDPFDCQSEYSKLFDDAIRKLKMPIVAVESFKKSASEAMSYLRILSLSINEVNPLLWAHYADSHRGFCLGFDDNHFNTSINSRLKPQKVKYRSDLPSLEFSDQLLNSNFSDKQDRIDLIQMLENFTYEVALTKPFEWKVEEEYRVVTQHPVQGKVISFNRLALREVIFGLNMDLKKQNEIMQILSQKEWKHVKLFKIEKPNGSFELAKKEIGFNRS